MCIRDRRKTALLFLTIPYPRPVILDLVLADLEMRYRKRVRPLGTIQHPARAPQQSNGEPKHDVAVECKENHKVTKCAGGR